jgi:hypothetical protein
MRSKPPPYLSKERRDKEGARAVFYNSHFTAHTQG